MLAFSSGNDAAVMFFLCVMENACGNNRSVAGAGSKKNPTVSLRIMLHMQKWEKKSYKKNIQLKQQLISSISKLAR